MMAEVLWARHNVNRLEQCEGEKLEKKVGGGNEGLTNYH